MVGKIEDILNISILPQALFGKSCKNEKKTAGMFDKGTFSNILTFFSLLMASPGKLTIPITGVS